MTYTPRNFIICDEARERMAAAKIAKAASERPAWTDENASDPDRETEIAACKIMGETISTWLTITALVLVVIVTGLNMIRLIREVL